MEPVRCWTLALASALHQPPAKAKRPWPSRPGPGAGPLWIPAVAAHEEPVPACERDRQRALAGSPRAWACSRVQGIAGRPCRDDDPAIPVPSPARDQNARSGGGADRSHLASVGEE